MYCSYYYARRTRNLCQSLALLVSKRLCMDLSPSLCLAVLVASSSGGLAVLVSKSLLPDLWVSLSLFVRLPVSVILCLRRSR